MNFFLCVVVNRMNLNVETVVNKKSLDMVIIMNVT